MSDGGSPAADSEDGSGISADESGDVEPGGGPQRVVSETSVDDILDSLNETKSDEPNGSDGDPAPKTRLEGDYVASNPDSPASDEVAAASSSSTDSDSPVADASGQSATGAETDGHNTDDEIENTESIDDSASTADPATIDDTDDGLADRIERGTVTGADVRAAEAGDGREETPEIDDIELTMDDLDQSSGPSPGSQAATAIDADAGPLAGSIDDSDSRDGDESDSSGGVLDRLKGLFSR